MRHYDITADKRTTQPHTSCGWESLRRVGPGCRFGRVAFQIMIRRVNGRLRSLTVALACKFASLPSNAKPRCRPPGVGYRALTLGDDVECDLHVNVRVDMQRYRMVTNGFDVALGQTDDALVEIGSAGLFDRGDDVTRGHRTEQLARVARRPHRQRNGAHRLDRRLDFVGVLKVSHLLGVTGATDVLDLLLRAARRDDRQATREQEVATVSVLDLNGVADGTQVVDVGGQNELHCFADSVLR